MRGGGRGGWGYAWVVLQKELRETLRDTRTLLIMVVVPVVLYPALLIASEQVALFGQRQLDRDPAVVAVVGDVDPPFLEFVRQHNDLLLREVGDPEKALRSDSVSAVAIFLDRSGSDENRRVSLLYDAADDGSRRGRALLSRTLNEWADTLLERRIADRGLPVDFARPLSLADSSVALPAELGGYALGRFLPMLLVVMTLLGTFYPAIDLAAGEKERGTLETLLTAPIPPGHIVAGKFLTVTVIGLVAAALNLGSMLLTFQSGLFQLSQSINLEFSLRFTSVLVIFGSLVPLAVLFGALFLGIAVRSQSFKEAQNALTPVYMLFLLPAVLPLFPGIGFTPLLAIIPVAGVTLLFQQIMAGNTDLTLAALALLSTIVYACFALAFAAHSFGREEVLFGEVGDAGESRGFFGFLRTRAGDGAPEGVPRTGGTLAFVALVAVLYFYAAVPLQVAFGEVGLLVSEVALLLVPALLFLKGRGYDFGESLSLGRPKARDLLAAVLIIAGGTPLVWFLSWAQSFFLPMPTEFLEGMSDFLTAESLPRVLWLLALVALTPAICEEVMFRGVLLGGTRRHLPPLQVILLNGFVFGAFHVPTATVFRFLPTAVLGMLLAWVVLRTRSIWTGMLMHFLNNGSIVVLSAFPWVVERFSDPSQGPPLWLALPAAVSLTAGAVLLESGRRTGPDRGGSAGTAVWGP